MKRKRVTKHISLMLVATLLLQMFIVPGIYDGNMTVEAADTTETVTFEEDFDGDVTEQLLSSDVWDVETEKYPATAPNVVDGLMKMDIGDGVQFNWTQVSGVGTYSSNKTYTFEFDAKITDSSRPLTDYGRRTLYVAAGGYWNQVEINNADRQVRAGDTYKTYSDATYLNKSIHVKIDWKGQTITSTITDENSNELVRGYRTKDVFDYATSKDSIMKTLVLRCEAGAVEVDNFAFKVDGTTLHTEDFGFNPTDAMFASDVWSEEEEKSGITWTRPEIKDGVLKMDSLDSVKFFWTRVPEVGAFDSKMTYTFEFDAKITDDVGSNVSGSYTRALYFAPGGWYNQIGINDKDGKAQVGESSTSNAYDSNTYLNKSIHIKMEWLGTLITSTITNNADGSVIATGTRSNAAYDYGASNSTYMREMVLRCEDGAVEIDNFKFTKELKFETEEQNISIPNQKQAVYECNVTYSAGSITKLEVGGKTSNAADTSGELFRISDEGMAIGGYACTGSFGEGTYGVKAYLNPAQQAVNVEVTLPNGGVIRRGSHALLYNCTSLTKMILRWRGISEPVSNDKITYEDIDYNVYEMNTTEPVYEGFEANVYNLVTAFDVDAKTTRTFAWTALESFIGSEAMAVQYRVEGTDEWQTVDAVKETEKTEDDTEDYFKADITGLTAGTTYEYRIGKKNSTDTTNDWGKTYTFATQAENVEEFSFISIGDTQGTNWDGTSGSETSRGFMFAQAALEQAFEDIENPAFILHTGDIVERGVMTDHWNRYFKALGDFGKTTAHFAAIGNHDTWGDSSKGLADSADNFDLHFNHPNNGGSAAFAEGTVDKVNAQQHPASMSLMQNLDETTYSFNYGDVHFVVLNTGTYDWNGAIDRIIINAQREWLIADLEANADAEWTIVMMHQPPYNSQSGTYDRLGLNDIIEDYGVDLAIVGHSHIVTRTYPMKNGSMVSNTITNKIEAGTGTVYSTIGSTTPNHDQLSSGIQEYIYSTFTPVNSQPTYSTVTVNDNEIKVAIKQINGLVVDEYTIFKEVAEFEGVSLELGDKIGVNFYISEDYNYSDDAYVEFELEDGEKRTVSIKDAENGRKFTCWVPAKEMADMITATLYDDGEAKHTISTSVRNYAETIISKADSKPEWQAAKPLVNAMLNYGAYAQKLFDYNTDDLANKYDKVQDNVKDVAPSQLAVYAKDQQGLENFGYLEGTSLVLKSETKLKMFFKFEEGASLDGLSFSVDGVQQEFTVSENYHIVEITDISAHLLDKEYKVTVTAGSQTFDACVSAMAYCYSALVNKDDDNLHNAVKALYLYNKEADAYLGN